ncbi:MAG: pilus assembly protein PilM [candidate division NC10 bacterium]|nr:pilus assembly protein PilM [candidate division NC10 bacterium]
MVFRSTSLGIEVRDDAIRAVLLGKRFGRIHFLWEGIIPLAAPIQEEGVSPLQRAAEALAVELKARKARPEAIVLGLPRRAVTLRELKLPALEEEDLRSLLEYEAERHLPFPPDEGFLDFQILSKGQGTSTVLFVAAEKATVEGFVLPFQAAGLAPTAVSVSSFAAVSALLYGWTAGERSLALVALQPREAELALVQGGVLRYCRSVVLSGSLDPVLEALEGAVGLLNGAPEASRQIVVEGEGELREELALKLLERMGVGIAPFSLSKKLKGPTTFPPLAPLGLALVGLGALASRIDLLPGELKPKRWEKGLAVMLGLLGLIVLIGLSLLFARVAKEWFLLKELEERVSGMQAMVEEAKKLAADLSRLEGELKTLERLEASSPRRLEVLRELATVLPKGTSITSLTIDGDGLKLSGSAADAASFVALLEASPIFQQVEFTAPLVTRDREKGRQEFQLKAQLEGSK